MGEPTKLPHFCVNDYEGERCASTLCKSSVGGGTFVVVTTANTDRIIRLVLCAPCAEALFDASPEQTVNWTNRITDRWA